MQDTTLFKRLMALAKLRTEGQSPFLRQLGFIPSNAITAVKGSRTPQTGLIESLKKSLGFQENGFTDVRLEAWLARTVEDLESLVTVHGFDIHLLTRLVTDREHQGKSHQYKFCLLHVGFGMSGRYVLLRMTYDKLDEFIAKLKLTETKRFDWVMAPKKAGSRALIDYAMGIQPLMEINTVLQENVDPPSTFTATQIAAARMVAKSTVDDVLAKIDEFLKNPGPVKAKRAKTQSLYAGEQDRGAITRQVGLMVESSYDIRRERIPNKPRTQLIGLTNSEANVPIEIEVIFPGDEAETIFEPSAPNEQLVVVQVHASGLSELIFNGPKKSLYESVKTLFPQPQDPFLWKESKVTRNRLSRLIKVHAIRLLGARVPHEDRLKIRS